MSPAYAPVPEPSPARLVLLRALDTIGSLQHRITVSRAVTLAVKLADAVVQLRRLVAMVGAGAMLELDWAALTRLVVSIRAAVERAVDRAA